MNYITAIGLLAGFCTTISFLPQIIKIYRTRQTQDLALNTYILLSCGLFFWVIYGFFLKEIAIILTNIIVLFFSLYIIRMKVKYG